MIAVLRRSLAMGLTAAMLAGCSRVGGGASGPDGRVNAFTHPHVLRYGDIGDLVTLNPMLGSQLVASFIGSMTMAWLIRFDRKNAPIPEVATVVPSEKNGGISADGKTITYHLRHGVKWSDGAPFTAADVAFSVKTILDPKTNVTGRDGWDLITKVDTPDPYTVAFHLKAPYSAFIPTFFTSAGANPAIVPKHLLEHSTDINRDPYNSKPVGIGPFRVVAWNRGDRVVLERNPYYWRGRAKLDRIEYHIVPNRDTLVSQLQTGDLDLWAIAPPKYLDRFQKLDGYSILRQTGYGFSHLDFNVVHPALRDVAVRRALVLALDRRELRHKVGNDVGVLQDAIESPASPYFDKSLGFTEHDTAKANAVLDAAGWKRGADGIRAKKGVRLALSFASNSGSPDTDTRIELIRSYWKAIGVDFDRKNYAPSLLFAQMKDGGIVYGGKWDVIVYAWFLGPTANVSTIYSCDQFPPNGQNANHYCDATAQAAMVDEKRTYDSARQIRDNQIVQRALVRDVPTVVTAVSEDLYVMNKDLKGFHPNQVTEFDDMLGVDI